MIKSFKNCESKKTFLKFRHLRNFRNSDPLEDPIALVPKFRTPFKIKLDYLIITFKKLRFLQS